MSAVRGRCGSPRLTTRVRAATTAGVPRSHRQPRRRRRMRSTTAMTANTRTSPPGTAPHPLPCHLCNHSCHHSLHRVLPLHGHPPLLCNSFLAMRCRPVNGTSCLGNPTCVVFLSCGHIVHRVHMLENADDTPRVHEPRLPRMTRCQSWWTDLNIKTHTQHLRGKNKHIPLPLPLPPPPPLALTARSVSQARPVARNRDASVRWTVKYGISLSLIANFSSRPQKAPRRAREP